MKVMILSTKHTGMGHASIASAISDALIKFGHSCQTFDMVDMCKGVFASSCKSYGKVTNRVPLLWGMCYHLSNTVPKAVKIIAKKSFKAKFIPKTTTSESI